MSGYNTVHSIHKPCFKPRDVLDRVYKNAIDDVMSQEKEVYVEAQMKRVVINNEDLSAIKSKPESPVFMREDSAL